MAESTKAARGSAAASPAGGDSSAAADAFSLRRPRDIVGGIACGLKSVGSGIVGGAVGLVTAPVIGAANDGISGFAMGVATGMAGAVLLPATGVTVGVVQVARGVMAQPEALVETLRGSQWDEARREWVPPPRLEVALLDDGRSGRCAAPPPRVACYYALLQVSRDASDADIKHQYYRLARRHHPDKAHGDPHAAERFAQLGEAYQVLSNPKLRRRYDACGRAGVSDAALLDPGTFYASLFGSELFEHLLGELAVTTLARAGGGCSSSPTSAGADSAAMKRAQARREGQLADNLNALLRRHVEGDAAGFKLTMAAEVRRLSAASFGVTLLRCIGSVYTAHADMALGGLLGGALARVRDGGAAVRCHLDVASAALRVAGHQERLAAFERQCAEQREQQVVAAGPSPAPDSDCQVTVELGGGGAGDTCKVGTGSGAGHLRSGDESQPAAQQPLPNTADEAFATRREALETDGARLLLEAMWAANVLDLRTTLSRVCRAVLYDPRASSGLRRRRARALRELGQTFAAARSPSGQPQDARQQMQAAYETMLARQMEAEADAAAASAAEMGVC